MQWTMLLGEHEHSLDDKNRLTLPAKLRAAFEEGVVLSRGLDGCLAAYRRGYCLAQPLARRVLPAQRLFVLFGHD